MMFCLKVDFSALGNCRREERVDATAGWQCTFDETYIVFYPFFFVSREGNLNKQKVWKKHRRVSLYKEQVSRLLG